ncbi:MAG: sulfite exporter TauE/SafE family protein [Dehalococcoidia bacterium]|jgi:hypothetical protein|nr:sulfite exporter TauE/SafE family protein [Dehalococcoidia bacterium]
METALVIAVLCLATLVHGTLGFGTGLVAMPLLALTVGVRDATALVAFVILGTTIIILGQSWRALRWRAAVRLVIGSVAGIPLGIFVLTSAPAGAVQRGLGVVLVAVGLYSLAAPRLFEARHAAWAYACGFVGGLLGGAYNANAPPVVVYGALRRWPPVVFRATLQAYFVPAALLIWAGHGVTGLWTREIVGWYLLYLPFGLIVLVVGQRLSARLPEGSFDRVLYAAIAVLGVVLLF